MSTWSWRQWIEVAALAMAVGVPAVRLLAQDGLRRIFPRVAVAAGLAVFAWLAFVFGLARWWPTALDAVFVAALVMVPAAVWYARSSYGRSRGLPPGSLSVVASVGAIVDRDFYRRQATRHGPVFKMLQFHQPVVCIVGLERGHRLIREHEDALGPSLQRVTEEIPGGFLRYMGRETHAVYGSLFRQALSAAVVADADPAIRAAVRRELGGACDPPRRRIDPTQVLERITDAAFLRTLFGLEPGTPAFDEFVGACQPLARRRLSQPLNAAARASLAELRRLALSRLSVDPTCDGGRPTRSAITELRRLDARMPDATALDNLIFIWKISASNAVGLLRWLLARLGENPGWCARLKAEFAADAGPSSSQLVDRVISETLRLSQSEYLYRRTRVELTFDGFRLPKNWLVRICVAESHRDARVFPDPDRFDPDRFVDQDYPRTAYSPFGTGRHACNGVPLAMEIAHAFLEELSRSWDWSVEGSGAVVRDFRHWSHWRPGPDLRLVLGTEK